MDLGVIVQFCQVGHQQAVLCVVADVHAVIMGTMYVVALVECRTCNLLILACPAWQG